MKMLIAGLAGTMLVAVPAAAQQVPAPAGYVAAAGASDRYERESSQLVLQSTRNPSIRSFAQTMIRHHAKSTADVTAAAARAGVRPSPPRLTAEQGAMIAQLRAQNGEARDRLYVTQQKTAHQQALALHRGYAEQGTATPLKTAAGKIVPVVQGHIDMLQSM